MDIDPVFAGFGDDLLGDQALAAGDNEWSGQ